MKIEILTGFALGLELAAILAPAAASGRIITIRLRGPGSLPGRTGSVRVFGPALSEAEIIAEATEAEAGVRMLRLPHRCAGLLVAICSRAPLSRQIRNSAGHNRLSKRDSYKPSRLPAKGACGPQKAGAPM
jgi:hypothetical protein